MPSNAIIHQVRMNQLKPQTIPPVRANAFTFNFMAAFPSLEMISINQLYKKLQKEGNESFPLADTVHLRMNVHQLCGKKHKLLPVWSVTW
jgi:hypothetical protein